MSFMSDVKRKYRWWTSSELRTVMGLKESHTNKEIAELIDRNEQGVIRFMKLHKIKRSKEYINRQLKEKSAKYHESRTRNNTPHE